MSAEAEQAAAVSRERAAQDLEDIKALRESTAFRRYFMRRLKQRRDTLDEKFRRDHTLTHEQREVHRCLVNEYDDEIAQLMARDERGAQSTLSLLSQ